ncbi:hypothetical protein ABPG72_020867, partial [Tetrahymena utriculariae]
SEESTIINMAFLHFISQNFKYFLNIRLRDVSICIIPSLLEKISLYFANLSLHLDL